MNNRPQRQLYAVIVSKSLREVNVKIMGMRFALGAVSLIVATCSLLGSNGSAFAVARAHSESRSAPSVGYLTIRPKKVHVGGKLTITGITRRRVQFLPPFVSIETLKQHVVHRKGGLCAGTSKAPIGSFGKAGGGAGGPGTRSNPPGGTAWKVTIRVPPRVYTSTSGSRAVKIPTPAGRYRVGATGFGLDFCSLPSKSTSAWSIGYLQVVK